MVIPLSTLIVAGISLSPLISLIAGILILVMPRLLNFIVAIYLIIIGLVGRTRLQQSASCPKRWGGSTIPCRVSSTPTVPARTRLRSCGSKLKVLWTKTVGTVRCRTRITSWNRTTARSSGGQCESAFPIVLRELGAPSPATRPCT